MPRLQRPDGVELHWEQRGQGPLLVLAPYWSGHPGVYEALLSDLARDHRVVTWDARATQRADVDARAARGGRLPDLLRPPGARSGTGPGRGGGRPNRRGTGDRGAPLDPLRPRRRRTLAAARTRAPKAGRDADPEGACRRGRGGRGADLAPRPVRRRDPPDHRTAAPRIERVSASPSSQTWI